MKYGVIIFVFVSGCMLYACTNSASIKEGNVFNIETAIQTEMHNVLSDLCDSLVCIPLETNDSSLLDKKAYLMYADEYEMFIRSNEYLYRFKSDGHFLNRIGCRGSAPGEYSMLYSISVDEDSKRLLFYIGQKKVQYWGYDGTFQSEILLLDEGEITAVGILGKNRIIAENRQYSDSGLETSILIFDMDGKLIKKIPMNRDKYKVNLSMHTVPLMYGKGNAVRYKDINYDVLYSFSEESIEREWRFDLGRYMPNRDVLEDVDKKKILMRDFAQLVDIKESTDHFYLLIVHDNHLRGIVIDKDTGQIAYSQIIVSPQSGGGMENDYISKSYFWPSYISNSNVLYCLLPAENMASNGKEYMKKYLREDTQFIDEANPIVLKVYGK